MKFLILLFGLIPFAFSTPPIIYFIGTQSIVFEKVEDVFITKKCSDKKCEAYINSKKYKDAKLDPSWLMGGKNPNSVKCSRVLGGEVLIAEDIKGNKQSVCRFKDNSFLL